MDDSLYDMSKTYTITFSDGSRLTDLHVNGNNFVSDFEVTEQMFKGKMSHIEIYDGEVNHEFDDVELLQIMPYDGKWYFVIREIPKEQLEKMQMQANIEYLAMMTDVEL